MNRRLTIFSSVTQRYMYDRWRPTLFILEVWPVKSTLNQEDVAGKGKHHKLSI